MQSRSFKNVKIFEAQDLSSYYFTSSDLYVFFLYM
jgi:hypothetical protein